MASTLEFVKYNITKISAQKLAFDFTKFAIDGVDKDTSMEEEGTYIFVNKPLPETIKEVEYIDELEIRINGIEYTFSSEIGYWASDYQVGNLCDGALTKALIKWLEEMIQ